MMIKARKLISVLLIFMLVFSSTLTAFADEDAEAEVKEDQKKQEEQLKAKQEAEKKAAEEKAKKEAEKKAAEEKAKQEAEKKAAEEQAEKETEEKAESDGGDADKDKEPAAEQQSESEAAGSGASEGAEDDGADEVLIDQEDPEDEPEDEDEKKKTKLQSELTDGTYEPDSFEFSGGTGKAKVTCDKVIVKDGKYYGVFTASSDNMTHFYMGAVSSDAEDTSLYDPATDKCGENVYKISKNVAYVPVVLDEQKPFAGRTTAMSEPHWIQYYYKLTLSDSAKKISDDTTIPDDSGDSGDEPDDPTEPDEPTDTSELKDGTYKVKATTCRVMFYLYPKEKNPATVVLVKKNGKMTATITLTGDGYDYVYMGTPAQAKKAGKKNWIKYKKVNGYYTFTIPVSKLDKKLPITPHSSKYESDGDPSTDPWRPDKWILFYSSGAKKVKDGTTINPKKKNSDSGNSSSKNDKKAEKESKYKDDSGKSTSAVNNSTSLKDGVYKPDRFNWSGGSGRLAYIRCNKITVKGGKAFATIEFSSSKYDSLKANGRIYSKSGGGNSKFTIPVKLNANNTIIGRTTAMSQPHWVKYRIFIYKKGADAKSSSDTAEGDDGHLTSTKKLSDKAPDLLGLEFKEAVEIKYAKYFKIFKYEQGIILISVDQSSNTALKKEEDEKEESSGDDEAAAGDESGDTDSSSDGSEEKVEYDEDGKPIAKAQNEITEELYQNNVVNYLIVPEKAELPAGLEKDCVIIQQPVKASYIASDPILTNIIRLGRLDCIAGISMDVAEIEDEKLKEAVESGSVQALNDAEKPDYASIVKMKADFAVLPDTVLPAKVDDKSTDDEKKESEELSAKLGIMQSRFAALGVPMIVDRSSDEKTNYGTAEWIKVYGAVYGEEDKAKSLFEEYIKKNDEEENA